MKKSFGDYRLLAGGNRRVGSLWEGPEHLLLIETAGFMAGFTETYRRIDYKNIQAVSVARTRRGPVLAFFMILLLVMPGLGIVNFHSELGPSISLGICVAVILIALIVHLVRGPTCICKVQTAVQFLQLKPIDRMRKAESFVQRLSVLCAAHQGGLEFNPASPTTGAPVSTIIARQDVKQPWTGSRLVNWALVLLIISGALMITDVFIKNMLLFMTDALVGIAAYSLAVAALVRASRFELPAALKFSLRGAMANFVLCIATYYGIYTYAVFAILQKTASMRRQNFGSDTNIRLYRYLSDAGFAELGWAAWVLIAIGAFGIFLGLLGLPSALRPAAKPSAAVPPSRPPSIPKSEESMADTLP